MLAAAYIYPRSRGPAPRREILGLQNRPEWCKMAVHERPRGEIRRPGSRAPPEPDTHFPTMPNETRKDTIPAPPAFTAREVLCRTSAADGDSLVAELVRLVASGHDVGGADAALAAVLARQHAAPVFPAPGVAIPHARIPGIAGTFVAVATSPSGVKFAEADDPVRLAILVLTPAEAPAGYLRVAAGIARRLSEPGFVDRVSALSDAPAVVAALTGGEERLDGNVTARDLMEPAPAVLRETDGVKAAIDLIVRTGLTEIPVVDRDGALVGEASAKEVLGLCIPDYLLWMENLSGFSNFEPFATLLRKEADTWLADIMSDGYASVQADRPAIAVAEALARKDAGVCYVLDGDKLAGVVTLPRFLDKVFRD